MSENGDELVVREEDLEWTENEPDEDHAFRRKQLGAAAGSEDLGASRYAIAPGKRLWHRHYHTANEEAVYVLDGSGTITLGPDADAADLSPGTFVALPADERGDHELQAGDEGLEVLMFSTMEEPDVLVYPDEDMVGLFAGSPPGGDGEARTLSCFLDLGDERDYWE